MPREITAVQYHVGVCFGELSAYFQAGMLLADVGPMESVYVQGMELSSQIINGNVINTVNA